MRINEIARIAQITPRAIRHYHRVSALPEPERRPNGYRDYSVIDLTRLLRLRRLLSLGLPLSRIGPVLQSASDTDIGGELAEIEVDLHRQIGQLRAQLLAVRTARISPTPGSVALYDVESAAMRELWASPDVRRIEHDVAALLDATVDETLLSQLRAELSDPATTEQLAHISRRLRDLTEQSSPGDISATTRDLVSFLATRPHLTMTPAAGALIEEYIGRSSNSAQAAVLAAVGEQLDPRAHKT